MIAFPGYLTFFYITIPTLLTVTTWLVSSLEPLSSYYLNSIQHFSMQVLPSAPLCFKQQACSKCISCSTRDFLLCSNLCKHPDLCFTDNCWETELRCGCFLSSTLVLCYDQFLVAFNLFISTAVCVYIYLYFPLNWISFGVLGFFASGLSLHKGPWLS